MPPAIQGYSAEELTLLQDPAFSLPMYGRVKDMKTRQIMPYDPFRLTRRLQAAILGWVSNPPRDPDSGQTLWLTVLGYRQGGKSLTGEYAFYPRAATTPGYAHACIADNIRRARKLHQRVHRLDLEWPEDMKAPRVPSREVNQLTFRSEFGGAMTIMTAQRAQEGIGQALDSLHGSECPFWPDFNMVMALAHPGLMNINASLVLLESTPAPTAAYAPSADQWRDHCDDAMLGEGRYRFVFFPFWDGKLNVRPWPKSSPLTLEEQRLFDRYGPQGLTIENLAFRRFVLATDAEFRRDPQLFPVFYPFDLVSCWGVVAGGTFQDVHIAKLQERSLQPWTAPEKWYKRPDPKALHLLAVDPTGEAARDHGAIQGFECWSDSMEEVYSFSGHIQPDALARKTLAVSAELGGAKIAVENNGVGQGFIAYIRSMGGGNLLLSHDGKRHGFNANVRSIQAWVAETKLAIMDGELILNGEHSVSQMQTYRNDKMIEMTPRQAALRQQRGATKDIRRDRGHWDTTSATIMGVHVARKFLSKRLRMPVKAPRGQVVDFFTALERELAKEDKDQLKHIIGPYSRIRR